MKMFLLSADEDTLTGLRLAGISGALIENEADFAFWRQKVQQDSSIAILLVTRTLGEIYADELLKLKKAGSLIVTEVPDINSEQGGSQQITRYIRDAVGIVG